MCVHKQNECREVNLEKTQTNFISRFILTLSRTYILTSDILVVNRYSQVRTSYFCIASVVAVSVIIITYTVYLTHGGSFFKNSRGLMVPVDVSVLFRLCRKCPMDATCGISVLLWGTSDSWDGFSPEVSPEVDGRV